MTMFNPPHPGEVISGILDELGVSERKFAQAMDIAPSTANRLTSGKTALTTELALKLAVVIGGSPMQWLDVQAKYNLWRVEKQGKVNLSRTHRLIMA